MIFSPRRTLSASTEVATRPPLGSQRSGRRKHPPSSAHSQNSRLTESDRIPKELIAQFVKGCPSCMARRSPNRRRARSTPPAAGPGPGHRSPQPRRRTTQRCSSPMQGDRPTYSFGGIIHQIQPAQSTFFAARTGHPPSQADGMHQVGQSANQPQYSFQSQGHMEQQHQQQHYNGSSWCA